MVQILGMITVGGILWLAIIFLLAMITEMGIPTFPIIEGLLVFAGFQIVHGAYGIANLAPFLVLAPMGRLCGSASTYWLSHSLGDRLIDKFGKRFRLTRERLEKTKQRLTRRALPSIIIARLAPGLGILASITYGASHIQFRRFITGVLIQLIIWEAAFLALGALGGGIAFLFAPESHPLFITIIVLAVIGMGVAAWYFVFRQTGEKQLEKIPSLRENKS